jgi:hypothetical protein
MNCVPFWRNTGWNTTNGICGIRSPFQGLDVFYSAFLGLRPRLTYFAPLGLAST